MRRIILTLTLLTLLMLSGCNVLSNENQLNLAGTSWRLVSYEGVTPLPGKDMTANFTEHEIRGSTSCNSYFGEYKIKGDEISIDGLGWTEMACLDPEGIMEQEQAIMRLLSQASDISQEGNSLVIMTDSGSRMIFSPQEPTD
jgi:heat shock protein HslJ